VTVFEAFWNGRENYGNMHGKWCILTVFQTIWKFKSVFETAMRKTVDQPSLGNVIQHLDMQRKF